MTLRLVGLISIVLLLCMATFAFVTRHYQDEVMDELAKTVSEVGKATFHSIEGRQDIFVGKGVVAGISCPPGPDNVLPLLQDNELKRLEVVARAIHADVEEDGGAKITIDQELTSENGGETVSHVRIVYTDAITVIDGPGQEMALKIPMAGATTEPDGPQDNRFRMVWMTENGNGGGTVKQVRPDLEEIILPIPTEDYRSLFTTFRKKSIFLFCGVFAVGIALSTGLASRFTRPVRRLDSGIKRLADGDLDVQVLVRGNDEVARLGLAFNDMTRRLRAGRERSREMTRREKLSALGRLGAGVAHDVRNPLHSIGLTLQHLEETCRPRSGDRAEQFDRSVGIIKEEIGRLDRLVDNFLRFARSGCEEHRLVDPVELLNETADLVRKEAEWRGVEVDLRIEDPVPMIEVDVEAVRSSLLNLVLNSFEAMPQGGSLVLSMSRADDAVVMEVTDTGIGIPTDDKERVFDFAYSTRENGSGLGLAMVHQCVVEEHGGRIGLDSREGAGTTIRLEFPVPDDTREDQA